MKATEEQGRVGVGGTQEKGRNVCQSQTDYFAALLKISSHCFPPPVPAVPRWLQGLG